MSVTRPTYVFAKLLPTISNSNILKINLLTTSYSNTFFVITLFTNFVQSVNFQLARLYPCEVNNFSRTITFFWWKFFNLSNSFALIEIFITFATNDKQEFIRKRCMIDKDHSPIATSGENTGYLRGNTDPEFSKRISVLRFVLVVLVVFVVFTVSGNLLLFHLLDLIKT